jgi:hypothetical protein
VEITGEGVDVARRELEGTIRPILADVPLGLFRESVRGPVPLGMEPTDPASIEIRRQASVETVCTVPMRNVGTGVAVLESVTAQVDNDQTDRSGEAQARLIPPGEIVRLSFHVPIPPEDQFWVRAPYTDIANGQLTRTKLYVRREDGEGWRVRGTALYRGEETTPFVGRAKAYDLEPGFSPEGFQNADSCRE